MKLLIEQITESPQSLRCHESVAELNDLCRRRAHPEFKFPAAVDLELVFYRSGREIFLQGSLRGPIRGECSRCLEDYSFPVDHKFALVLVPGSPGRERRGELNEEEMGVSFYQGAEINLAPLIQEQVLLALPIRPLCDEHCRGLCVGCGINLNEDSCRCEPSEAHGRMAQFPSLRVGR